jgi:hypothetical protein
MFVFSELFLHGLLIGIFAIFALFSCFLEFIKYKQAKLALKTVRPYPLTRLKLRFTAYGLGFVILLLFLLGYHALALNQNPLFFVLYWWFTFTLCLLMFLFPALEIKNSLKDLMLSSSQLRNPQEKNSKNVVVRMIYPNEEKPSESDDNGGPTVH